MGFSENSINKMSGRKIKTYLELGIMEEKRQDEKMASMLGGGK